MDRIITIRKIVVSAVVIAAITILAAGVTYARLSSRTDSVVNDFSGACVNIGVVEKNKDNNEVVLEDAGTDNKGNSASNYNYDENNKYNYNILSSIDTDNKMVTKEVSVKNITSPDYPTTDTLVRVRLVPLIVYDDNEENQNAGIAGQTVPADIRDKIDYILAEGVVSEEEYKAGNGDNNSSNARWMYKEAPTKDINDRYYYYTSALAPGETSDKLLESVIYNGEIQEGTHLELRVLAEGIAELQAEYLQ